MGVFDGFLGDDAQSDLLEQGQGAATGVIKTAGTEARSTIGQASDFFGEQLDGLAALVRAPFEGAAGTASAGADVVISAGLTVVLLAALALLGALLWMVF